MITKKLPIVVVSAVFALAVGHSPAQAQELRDRPGQLICAGNIPPDQMVITATGDSKVCGGSCRAREIKPVDGSIMIICAQQPVPEDYELQSVTTSPACGCLGEQDNAYVIRLRDDALSARRKSRAGELNQSMGAVFDDSPGARTSKNFDGEVPQ